MGNLGRACVALLVVAALGVSACGGPAPEDDGGAGIDGSSIDAPTSSQCETDGECSNGTFCDGAETCDPADPAADARGCVDADSPCMPTQTCDEAVDRCVTECPSEPDADGDGIESIDCGGTDCDDSNSSVRPGGTEVCDTADLDEDCDPSTFGIRDSDGDDEPDASCCNADPAGGAPRCGTDCDDTRAGVSPVATETCNDRDDDCDSAVDETVLDTFHPDADGDGFGDAAGTPVQACFQPAGYAATATDCDDTRSGVNPGLGEQCDMAMLDENCDGTANPASLCLCTDGEARPCTAPGACAAGTETCAGGAWGACSIAPVTEVCNGLDDDCDGPADETLTVVCYGDGDNDGYAATGAALSNECPEAARSAVGGCPNFTTNRAPAAGTLDCDDTDATRRPTNPELCNSLDDDCDGASDEGIRVACFVDVDNDTYSPGGARMECPAADRIAVGLCPLGTTNRAPGAGATDCNDNVSGVRPNATETCTSGMTVDEDCDGAVDEGVAVACYADADGDSYAASGAVSSMQCRDESRTTLGFCPISYTNRIPTASASDCAPTNAAIHPGATEVCTLPAADEDCDGMANPGSICTCGDGSVRACSLPGVCATGTEQCAGGAWGACSVSPIAEICDGRDEDCDGTVDDGLRVSCYADGDNDTYAPAGASLSTSCPVSGRESVGGCPVNFTNRAPAGANIDCNDAASSIRPGATEVCSDSSGSVDEDCDGLTDEMLRATCYSDGDGDTYAPSSSGAVSRCQDPTRGSVGFCPASFTNRAPGAGATDCNDSAAAVSPGASEVCDRVDSNCSSGGGVALDEDADGDAHAAIGAACSGGFLRDDCRDAEATTYPGATEVCDRIDSNCSSGGGADTAEDVDGDGHSSPSAMCTGGLPKDDCLDTNASVYPGQFAYFGTPYCADGTTPNRCSAGNWYCDGGACPPVCSLCAPLTRASFDYDCNSSAAVQPVQSCTTSVGVRCALGGCLSGPVTAGGTCGETVSMQSCACGSGGPTASTCGAATATTGRLACH